MKAEHMYTLAFNFQTDKMINKLAHYLQYGISWKLLSTEHIINRNHVQLIDIVDIELLMF